MIIEGNNDNFEKEVLNGKVLVDFNATWCGPCRMLSPIIDELAGEVTDYKFYKLDVDENEELSRKYGIMSIPTLLIFENGELKQTLVGFKSKAELKEILK